MGWMDLTAAIAATRRAGGPCVTVSVDEIEFKKPIHLGDIVTIHAEIIWVGRSSMKIQLEVFQESWDRDRKLSLTGHMTFVHVDKSGKPRKIPD